MLEQPASLPASLVVVVDDHPADLARLLAGLHAHPPASEHELVLVANAPAGGADGLPQPAPDVQVIESAQRLGWADAVNLGLHRSRGRPSSCSTRRSSRPATSWRPCSPPSTMSGWAWPARGA